MMVVWKYAHPARKSPRATVRQSAQIVGLDGRIIAPCTMIDVSAGGAQLEFDTSLDVPESFILVLANTGRVRRECKVAWRGPQRAGVQFLPSPAKAGQ
jgi:hypothetical protein